MVKKQSLGSQIMDCAENVTNWECDAYKIEGCFLVIMSLTDRDGHVTKIEQEFTDDNVQLCVYPPDNPSGFKVEFKGSMQ